MQTEQRLEFSPAGEEKCMWSLHRYHSTTGPLKDHRSAVVI